MFVVMSSSTLAVHLYIYIELEELAVCSLLYNNSQSQVQISRQDL
jgi:hypothetical protein